MRASPDGDRPGPNGNLTLVPGYLGKWRSPKNGWESSLESGHGEPRALVDRGSLICRARRSVAALRAGDYAAADIIGFVTESSGSSDPVTLDLTGARLAGALTEARPPGYWAHPPER